jgi:hypothetical protein
MLETDSMAPMSGPQITLAACLTFIPTGVHVALRCCEICLLKLRPHGGREIDAGKHQWHLMQPFGSV